MSSTPPARGGRDHTNPRRRDANRAEAVARLRSVAVVAVFVAGALAAGSLVHATTPTEVPIPSSARLPVVNLASTDSVEWQCPGPLPAGGTPVRSSIVVINPGSVATTVQVDMMAVKARSGSAPLPTRRRQVRVAPHRERVVSLPTRGAVSEDAVSVLAPTGSVAVFESVSGPLPPASHPGAGGHGTAAVVLRAPEQAPCSTGATSSAYLAAGSTAGRSQVAVSLFNPGATEAVAAISVATPSGVTSPPTLQGVIVQPYSLQVFELAHSVVQQPTIAVTETTSVGRLVLGASTSAEADITAATSLTGGGLLVGIAAPQQTWTMASGLELAGRTVSVRVFDPGPRATSVTITCPVAGRATIELTATVAAGRVRDVPLPFAALAPSRSGRPAALPAGPITVRSAEGVGVVVSRQTVEQVGPHAETVALLSPSAQPAARWVLPASSSAQAVAGGVTIAGGVVVANGGGVTASVTVLELTASGPSHLRSLRTFAVAPGRATAIGLRLPPESGTAFAGLEVVSTVPVVAEADFYAVGPPQHPAPVMALPVEGVPVTP